MSDNAHGSAKNQLWEPAACILAMIVAGLLAFGLIPCALGVLNVFDAMGLHRPITRELGDAQSPSGLVLAAWVVPYLGVVVGAAVAGRKWSTMRLPAVFFAVTFGLLGLVVIAVLAPLG